jgi:predicted ATPase
VVIQTPDQRLRVFISSTMKELEAERAAVRSAIERLRLTPVLFELGARPHPPRDLYLAYLRQSHVFLGIYWEQYGWVAPGQEISGLEDEYLAAADKPKLIYLKTPAQDRHPRLTAMIGRIQSDGLSYRSFRSADELAGLVSNDLAVLLSERFETVAAPSTAGEDSHPRWRVPAAASSFLGRDRELAELHALLVAPGTRLVTLVGPGGIGKTRLALQVATGMADSFPDGVAAVMLAAVRSADLVPSAIATALGVPERLGRSPLEALTAFLRPRRMLLLLDNLEQVVPAAPAVIELLSAAERLTVLATSREILRLSGEHVFAVPPLATAADTEPVEMLANSDAVALFLDRARAARRGLPLDEDQIRTAAEICRRLDGLPLAIELAAARVRLLDPVEILRRLEHRLGVLTGGPRDLPERQRTLRDTIQWSYDLLTEQDRTLFTRLAVFTGGFSLDAAEAVCADDRVPDVLEGLASVVDKSLVRTEGALDGMPRFAMLDTVREFALERLDATGEADRVWRAHAEFFLRFALQVEPEARERWTLRLHQRYLADSANLGAAMRRLIDQGDHGRAAEMGLSLWHFWWTHSLFRPGIGWMEAVLAHGTGLTAEERARANLVLGMLAFGYGDYDRATAALRTALDMHDQLGDRRGVATASIPLGLITAATEHETGEAMLADAVTAFRELRDPWGLTFALFSLGGALLFRDRFEDAVPLLEESVEAARAANTPLFLGNALVNLGWAYAGLGELDAAVSALHESLEHATAMDNRETTARSLEALAAVALAAGSPDRGALLFGAAEGVRRSIGASVWGADRASHDRTRDALRTQLGDGHASNRIEAGTRLPLDDVLNNERARPDPDPAGTAPADRHEPHVHD